LANNCGLAVLDPNTRFTSKNNIAKIQRYLDWVSECPVYWTFDSIADAPFLLDDLRIGFSLENTFSRLF